MSEKFDWRIFSDLIELLLGFGMSCCSDSRYSDELQVRVMDRPVDCLTEEELGTVYGKRILLDWQAEDMTPGFLTSECPQRCHEDLLRRWFQCTNMDALFFMNRWAVFLWLPRKGAAYEHKVRYDNNDSSKEDSL